MRSTDAGNIVLEDNMLHLRRTYLERKRERTRMKGVRDFKTRYYFFFVFLFLNGNTGISVFRFFSTLTKNRVDRMVLLSRIGGIF